MNAQLLQTALTQYGITETPGKAHNPVVLNYFKAIGHAWVSTDETAWCSAFVNWVAHINCAERSGKLDARSWLKTGQAIHKPLPGDVAILWRESVKSWKGHVGFFISYSHDRRLVYLLGGNQNNHVCIQAYPASRLLGFRRLRGEDHLKKTK